MLQKCDLPVLGKLGDSKEVIRVDMNGIGFFNTTELTSPTECPKSHFMCPGRYICLPVYLRCNGVPDCPLAADELDCESYICPGYYRCWKSQVSHRLYQFF